MRIIVLMSCIFLINSCSAQKSQLFGTDNKKAFELFGQALQQKDLLEYDKALQLLEKAIAKDPNYTDAFDLQGTLYLLVGKKPEAKTSFEQVLRLSPEHPYASLELAKLHFEEQDFAAVKKLMHPILQLGPRSPTYMEAQKLLDNAEFAEVAVKNPVPYEPTNLGNGVNTIEEEYFPGLSLDEQTLYYTRRDGRVNIYQQNEDLYAAKMAHNKWSTGLNLGKPINTEENEGAFSASVDGKFLFFTSCSRKGGVGRCDIWVAEKIGDKWKEPLNLGRPVNTRDWESQPSLAPDGVTLYFVSNRPGGFGGTDIWVSKLVDGAWTDPKNLGPEVNTPEDEQFPFIHPDGVSLYFSSYGHPGMGKSDIFLSRFDGKKWGPSLNLGYPINTMEEEWNFIVNRTGETAYMSSDRLENGFGGMDIYSFPLYKKAQPQSTSYVKGIVFDAKTKAPLYSDVVLYDLSSGEKITSTYSDASKGDFLLALGAGKSYAFEVSANGYLFYSAHFKLGNSSLNEPQILEIPLDKIEKGKPVVLNNVFFDLDKSELRNESHAELDVLVDFLNKNADVKIEIGGHTDNTGSAEHNMKLSNDRAKAVYNYLVSRSIDASRLSYKGYASEKPIADNTTEEGRAKNRRTEFRVI